MRALAITAAAALGLWTMPAAAFSETLTDVIEAGTLRCGISGNVPGFASSQSGDWSGFDVAMCQAVAAAVLQDSNAVTIVNRPAGELPAALEAGELDLIARLNAWSFSGDTGWDIDVVGVSYYDGHGFLVPKEGGVSSAFELGEKAICLSSGSGGALAIADFFADEGLAVTFVEGAGFPDALERYQAGDCAALAAGASQLAAARAAFDSSDGHAILPEIVSKDPLGPAVRHGDDDWADIVRWTLFALIAAEELGVTSANIDELAGGSANSAINRLLGTEGNLGANVGLDQQWALRAIMAGGNYGEIFERNIGANTPIGVARGLNAQWTEGGLLYAPPLR